jgi:hypothetical protein
MHNTQRRDGLLVRNAQPDTTAQASSSSPAVTANTQPWEIIRVRLVALDTNAQPRMAVRYPAAALALTKSYSSKLLAQAAQQAHNVQQPPQFLLLARLGHIL